MVESSVLLAQFLNGLSQMMLLVLIASGLSIVWGLMDVLNFAHGAFYMLGAYTGLTVLLASGNFFVGMLAAFVIVGLIGAVIEYASLRPLYEGDPVYHLLITFGYLIVIEEGVRLIWGSGFRSLDAPAMLQGSVQILGVTYPVYRLAIILIGVLFSVAIYYFFNHTDIGLIIRAGEHNAETVRSQGINLPQVFTLTFTIGIGMAALSGVVAAPLGGVQPNMGSNVIIDAFIVVIIGGVGDYRGVIVGAFLIAQIRSLGALVFPRFTPIFLLLVLLTVLVIKPEGLFGSSGGEA
jgi:branched-subunit amino acid ABC-type transport system permease component